jgi:hypothetical protein
MQTASRTASSVTVFVFAIGLLCGAVPVPAQSAAGGAGARAFDAALIDYERNHWPQAFAALARLADAGHPEAARIAWQMWRYGGALYRHDFAASARQVQAWSRLQGCSGDAASRACAAALQAP